MGLSLERKEGIMIKITLKDSKELEFEEPVPLFEAVKRISNSLAKEAVVAKVDGHKMCIRDSYPLGNPKNSIIFYLQSREQFYYFF